MKIKIDRTTSYSNSGFNRCGFNRNLKYGLFQRNTFHCPALIFGHNTIERQRMCDLQFRITHVS